MPFTYWISTFFRYPAQLDFSENLLFNRVIIRSALQSVGLDVSTLDDPYPPFDPLKALQSLRVAMLGSSAAMLAAAAGGGTGSINTPGGRASGTSEYGSSINRFSGWGTLPGSLGHGVITDNAFRNEGQCRSPFPYHILVKVGGQNKTKFLQTYLPA